MNPGENSHTQSTELRGAPEIGQFSLKFLALLSLKQHALSITRAQKIIKKKKQ